MAHGKFNGSPKAVTQKTGPTFTENDSAKFHGAGKTSGKFAGEGAGHDAKSQKTGPVFTENSTHISAPNADKPAKESKQISDKAWFDPHSTNRTYDANDKPVHTDAANHLKDRYPK